MERKDERHIGGNRAERKQAEEKQIDKGGVREQLAHEPQADENRVNSQSKMNKRHPEDTEYTDRFHTRVNYADDTDTDMYQHRSRLNLHNGTISYQDERLHGKANVTQPEDS